MRRFARIVTAAALALAAGLPSADAVRAQALPPHAWLFGTWSGGLFPASTSMTAQACLAQPVVIFTQDIVLRTSLTDPSYTQRLIVTARQTPHGADIQFTPVQAAAPDLMGIAPPAAATGFGCESPDVLHIERRGSNEIVFPGCGDFPNPLVRCPNG